MPDTLHKAAKLLAHPANLARSFSNLSLFAFSITTFLLCAGFNSFISNPTNLLPSSSSSTPTPPISSSVSCSRKLVSGRSGNRADWRMLSRSSSRLTRPCSASTEDSALVMSWSICGAREVDSADLRASMVGWGRTR